MRRAAYQRVMRTHGLAEHVEILPGDYTEEPGARAARELLAREHRPTAVFAGNDLCANGPVEALSRNGSALRGPVGRRLRRHPHGGAVYMYLTTVHQVATEMAEIAVQLCSERLGEQQRKGKDVVLTSALTVRGSATVPHESTQDQTRTVSAGHEAKRPVSPS